MEIKISKEYHFNRVEINFTVNENINEANDAINYMKYLLDEMDNLEFEESNKPKKFNKKEEEPKATEKQIALIKRLYGDQYDTDDLSAGAATCLINAYFNKK